MKRSPALHAGASSRRQYPTPLIVWISFVWLPLSIFALNADMNASKLLAETSLS
jgi:hypothetical protein